MGHLIHVLLTGHKTLHLYCIMELIDKSCVEVKVKLSYISLFILFATSFEDSNVIPIFFSFLTVCF